MIDSWKFLNGSGKNPSFGKCTYWIENFTLFYCTGEWEGETYIKKLCGSNKYFSLSLQIQSPGRVTKQSIYIYLTHK